MPPPRLLGAFDPLLLGRPFGLVDGRAVATWRLTNGKVTIEHLDKVKKRDAAALEADAEAVLEYLGHR